MRNDFNRSWNNLNKLYNEVDKVRCSFTVGSSEYKKLAKILAEVKKMREKIDATI